MTERFTLLAELGRGGMGVVWKARDEETGQIVALKLLREVYAEDADYVTRFERELELAKRIHSPNVVGVLGFGVRQGVPYLALEYVDGPSLRERLADHGPYSWVEARPLLAQIAQGLADAHAAGVIHRDLKPSNVLIGLDGVAKLADFGIAKGLDQTRVTGTSTLLGTPAYLAPEGPADSRSDLYSLGVIAYEVLTGVVPFEGRTYQEVILRHVREAPDLAKLPKEARQIVGRLLAKRPVKRPQSASELLSLLARGASAPAIPAPPEIEPVAPVALTPPLAPPARPHWPARRPAVAALGLAAVAVVLGSALLASGFVSAGRVTPTASTSGALAAATTRGAAGGTPPVPTLTATATARPTAAPGFAATGSMTTPRSGATATLLKNGKVLIAGGTDGTDFLASAELYDPQAGTFTPTGSMPTGRTKHTATLLDDGRVLITGGVDGYDASLAPDLLSSAYLYDPATGVFSRTGSLLAPMYMHSATLLANGKVLIEGAQEGSVYLTADSLSELYDPASGTFSVTGALADGRWGHTATLLADGGVLVTGGAGWFLGLLPSRFKATAEIYDLKTGAFRQTGSMSTGRWNRTATLLSDGRVLMTGGEFFVDWTASPIPDAEVYDPATGNFTATGSMATARSSHAATLLPNGRVLIVGGSDGDHALASAELYDPATGTFSSAGSMSKARDGATATLLPDGRVLICGGSADAEVYTP